MNLFTRLSNIFKRSSEIIHANSPNLSSYTPSSGKTLGNAASAGIFAFVGILTIATISVPVIEQHFSSKATQAISEKDVLAAQTIQTPLDGTIVFSIPAVFKQPVTFESGQIINGDTVITGSVTAPNIIYKVDQGKGIVVTNGQNPTITNTGVLSLQGQTGDVNLTAGDGISIDGTKITNTAQGSTPKTFGTISVGGTTFNAESSTDTLSFVAGTGISLTTDTNNKSVTIANSGSGGLVNLATGVTGVLDLGNGGTGSALTPSAGGIVYSNSSTLAISAAGTTGQCLISQGSGTPIWSSCSGATNFWNLTSGVLSPGQITNDLAIGGNATSSALFQVSGTTGNLTGTGSLFGFSTFDGLSLTSNATGFAIAGGTTSKTLTLTSSLTLSGTDGTTFIFPSANDTLIGRTSTDTLTNKTLAAGSNTIIGLTNANLSGTAGITNANLANSSVTIIAGTGLSGGGSVSLGGTATLNSTGVLSVTGTPNQILANGLTTSQTGAVTLTLPQNIGTSSSPTFTGATLTGVGSGVVHSSSGVLSSSTIALGSEVSGTLPVANGGTGQVSFATNGILYGNGGGALQVTSTGSTGQVLGVDGLGTPVWTTISAGGSGSCTNCLSTNPSTTQTIQPTGNVTGLTVAQTTTASPSADIFAITNSTGTVKYIQVDSNGNVILNNNDLQLGGNINMKTDDTNLANIVDTFVYDTATDIDSGAWTDNGNAQAASWYNEPIAPTANCVLGLSTRCGTRPFPKRVIIVVRTTSVYVYDAQNDTLWMALNTGSGVALGSTTLSSTFALNGVLYIGTSSTGLVAFDFINDKIFRFDYNAGSGGRAQFLGTLAQRNTNIGYEARQSWGQIAADKVNGVFARVINGKTYIALATLGGANVIDLSDQKVVRYTDN